MDVSAQREFLDKLERDMRREVSLQRAACEEIWSRPLVERVRRGDSLGPMQAKNLCEERLVLVMERVHGELDCAIREGDFVRLSQDEPLSPKGHYIYLGEDDQGVHLVRWKGEFPSKGTSGLVVDPDFWDLSDRYAQAIEQLATSDQGRSRILPLLTGDATGTLDSDDYLQVADDLEEESESSEASWHRSQQDAIALCVAAKDVHLVQGPPGTGKTRVLAEVARRLVEKGERVLVTGPTHRAIHHALNEVRETVPDYVRVAKVGVSLLGGATYESHDNYPDSGLLDCGEPHVLGATPHAMWGNRSGLREARFDTVLLDESSQLTVLLAAMAMMRGERWLFFGDDCQLPPVVLGEYADEPRKRSIFGKLKNRGFDTMLEETWRLNRALAHWPSITFYHSRLTCRHDQRLHLSPQSDLPALHPEPALALVVCEGDRPTTVRSDEEAQMTAELVREAVRGGLAPGDIGVVTPFRAQAARVRQILRIGGAGRFRGVLIDTVDRFQGQQREVMIVSAVTSDRRFIERRASFLLQRERWNVAVTRARLKTILVVSSAFIAAVEALAREDDEGALALSTLIRIARPQTDDG